MHQLAMDRSLAVGAAFSSNEEVNHALKKDAGVRGYNYKTIGANQTRIPVSCVLLCVLDGFGLKETT